MIQNPVLLEPLNFISAINGISKLVDAFLDFGKFTIGKNESSDSPINGNTLLNMFGEWLFDSAAITKSGYEPGRAESVATLCRVFSKSQRVDKFHDAYLEKFYSVLQKVCCI